MIEEDGFPNSQRWLILYCSVAKQLDGVLSVSVLALVLPSRSDRIRSWQVAIIHEIDRPDRYSISNILLPSVQKLKMELELCVAL